MNTNSPKKNKEQRGVALFMAIFALMLAAAIAVGFMYMANSETLIEANYRSAQSAYFAARAGLEEGRARSQPGLQNAITLPTATPCLGAGCAGNVIYIINPKGSETVAPWSATNAYWDETLCKANYVGFNLTNTHGQKCDSTDFTTKMNTSTWYTSYTSDDPGDGTASAMEYKWVRIAVKVNNSNSPDLGASATVRYPYAVTAVSGQNDSPICWDGTYEYTLASLAGPPANCATNSPTANYEPVYMMTSFAVSSSGSKRVLQMEIGQTPPFFTNSAINVSDNVNLNGNFQTVGYDVCDCNCTISHSPGCDGPPPSTIVGAPGTCSASKDTIYATGSVSNPSGSETFLATGGNGISANNAGNGLPYSVPTLVTRFSTQANTINMGSTFGCTGTPPTGSCGSQSGAVMGTLPTLFPPVPNYNDAGAVAQTTYIPGDVDLHGATGSGILVVDGNLTIHGGIQWYGLIIVAGDVDFTGGGGGSNIVGAMIGGQSSIIDTLGGSAGFFYSSCALNKAAGTPETAIISQHELIY